MDSSETIYDVLARLLPGTAVAAALVALLINEFLNRNLPRIGGKIGRRRPCVQGGPLPDGLSRVECRRIITYSAPCEPERYATLKAYLRNGTRRQSSLVNVYSVAGCKTRIEIPVETPRYARIDAADALALLRELPDLRLVLRLQLSDEPAFLDPWLRRITGQDDIYHQGNATDRGLVVLYMPDCRLGHQIGTTLMHEWVHLLAFKAPRAVRRFRRANRIERLPPLPIPLPQSDPKILLYETWAELGEKLLGYDETLAREAALASPLHAMILWRQIEKTLRKVPPRFASTRLSEFEALGVFMQLEVAPMVRALRWRRWLRLFQTRR